MTGGTKMKRLIVGSRFFSHHSVAFLLLVFLSVTCATRGSSPQNQVELQPLVAQAKRLLETLDYLGAPLSPPDKQTLERALNSNDAAKARGDIQEVLDKYCIIEVDINPESRVKVAKGKASPALVEHGWRTFLVKVRNEAGITAQPKVESPNALPVFIRASVGADNRESHSPQQRVKPADVAQRWLDMSLYNKPPFKPQLSGLEVEYRIIQLYSRDSGKREAKISFNVGQGTQDIGFRNDVDILFTCSPSVDVTLRVFDERGKPATASFLIRDGREHVYPAQAKRLAPDFAFHPQIYRADGEKIRLPAGDYQVEFTRGPEYVVKRQLIKVSTGKPQTFTFNLERWIDLNKLGWYSGDHHIHAAGCMHYETPSQGVLPNDMIRHILGEALNVGSVLTWGPCYYYQKQFFEAKDHQLSTADNLMRYDVEVSGFPSSHAGHLVLLRLKDQDYPETKVIEDWPTWDLPILKWAKSQGAVVGFTHSGFGLEVKTDKLPHYEVPSFDGIGANEYIVDVTHDAVDFISTVDTPSIWELNIWYHTLNCRLSHPHQRRDGFSLHIRGACWVSVAVMSSLTAKLDYDAWVDGIRDGRSYVSDGKSHLVDFRVKDCRSGTNGSELKLKQPETVRVTAKVAARLDEKPNL